MKVIARIRNGFASKFGIPRQSGLIPTAKSVIVFEPEYRNAQALRGLEDFSHLWLIWEFSLARRDTWSPTVRPPRLGGNRRMGVFATRSPFRPNPIGLSCVKIEEIRWQTANGPEIVVSGADLMDGTPIYDIKPYLPYADCFPDAKGGFAAGEWERRVKVACAEEWMRVIPKEHRQAVVDILAQDPRPSYQHDPERVYGMEYAGMDIRFQVEGDTLTVKEIVKKPEGGAG
ncbi:MAG: tRNA (N6-threonylcarbamoyladenosine(37)-N6)-methyltransferase TrmO [Clostridia bacterium]|nr:tRNA (N6-threonylcarbamoyladenosine(37)-N6)-methyltransferase TrmO [Clostridia bacterium]